MSVEVKNKSRVLLDLTRIISGSLETEVQGFRGQVDNQNENQSQYLNMLNNYMKRSLI